MAERKDKPTEGGSDASGKTANSFSAAMMLMVMSSAAHVLASIADLKSVLEGPWIVTLGIFGALLAAAAIIVIYREASPGRRKVAIVASVTLALVASTTSATVTKRICCVPPPISPTTNIQIAMEENGVPLCVPLKGTGTIPPTQSLWIFEEDAHGDYWVKGKASSLREDSNRWTTRNVEVGQPGDAERQAHKILAVLLNSDSNAYHEYVVSLKKEQDWSPVLPPHIAVADQTILYRRVDDKRC